MNVEKDEGLLLSWWRGQRRTQINDQFSVTVSANGLPTVKWTTMEGTYNFFRKTDPDDRTWVIQVFSNTATINARSGNLVTVSQLILRYISANENGDPWGVKRLLFDSPNGEKNVLCDAPADDVRAFTLEQASAVELPSIDQARFRAGKLLFDDHHLARVELNDHTFCTLSRDLNDLDFTKTVIAALSREFIVKRPAEGWAALVQRKNTEQHKAAEQAAAAELVRANIERYSAMLALPAIAHAGRIFVGYRTDDSPSAAVHASLPPGTLAGHIKEIDEAKPRAPVVQSPVVSISLSTTLPCVGPDGSSSRYRLYQGPAFFASWSPLGACVTTRAAVSPVRHEWCKELGLLADVQIFTGREVTLPPGYFGRSDIMVSPDALIVALVFSDGAILPLCYTLDQSMACLERQRDALIEAWRIALALKQSPIAPSHAGQAVTPSADYDPI